MKEESKFAFLIFTVEEKIESESRKTIKKLEQSLNELKGDHYSLVRENKE